MKKKNPNYFTEKFHLLNSQATSDEISWSCSDSSDYEDIQNDALKNITNSTNRKRKRMHRKKKDPRNVSNLNITIVRIDEREKQVLNKTSPILTGKTKTDVGYLSNLTPAKEPLLPTTVPTQATNTPVTSSKYCDPSKSAKTSSPILCLKHETPKVSPSINKKLFKTDNILRITADESGKIMNKSHSEDSLYNRKTINNNNCVGKNVNYNQLDSRLRSITNADSNVQSIENYRNKMTDYTKLCNEGISIISTDSSSEDNDADGKKSSKLLSKVKSYFNSYFSSQGSEYSISECETPTPRSSSKISDDIDIINSLSQVTNITPSLKEVQTSRSFESDINIGKTKKVKYKKGGIGHRLNELLKKQKASTNLWQHERFMAANSNFVIPKEEFSTFRINNIDFKYNVYLLEVTNINDERYLVVINSIYVNNIFLGKDSVLKLYEPFIVMNCDNNCKIIINVSKFECGKMKF